MKIAASRWVGLVAAGSFMLATGCGSDNSSAPSKVTVKDYISGVHVTVGATPDQARRPGDGQPGPKVVLAPPATPPVEVTATYHDGTPPTGSAGPHAAGTENSTPLLGQPFRFSVAGDGSFSTVYVWIDGVNGYWQVDLPASVSTAELILQLAASPPQTSFSLQTALGANGNVGPAASSPVTTTDLSRADIAATVTWTGPTDVDLHVVDPNGVEVAYFNPTSPEGGKLNIDSNAGCSVDNVNREIISWPHGTAPRGTYKVWVEYFSDCGEPSTPWTLNVGAAGSNGVVSTVPGGSLSGTFTGTSADEQTSDTVSFDF